MVIILNVNNENFNLNSFLKTLIPSVYFFRELIPYV